MKGTLIQIVDKLRLRKKQHQATFGVPGTPVMCATPLKDSAHPSKLETCLETAVARDTIMAQIVEP